MKANDNIWANWSANWFGFFDDYGRPNGYARTYEKLPQFTKFIDSNWRYERIDLLLSYLEGAWSLEDKGWPIFVPCLLCQERLRLHKYHSDAKWLWPNSLSHYVLTHGIRPPDAMVVHIEEHKFCPPSTVFPVRFEALPWPPLRRVGFGSRIWSKFLFLKRGRGVFSSRK